MIDIPCYPEMRPVTIDDKALIVPYLNAHDIKVCEFNISNLIIWGVTDHPRLTKIHENPCILIESISDCNFFLQPLSDHNLEQTLDVCLDITNRISRVTENFLEKIDVSKYAIHPLREHFDYIFLTSELARMAGRKFDGKRNRIKKFQKLYGDYGIHPIDNGFAEKGMALFNEWFQAKAMTPQKAYKIAFENQRFALESAFSHFDALQFEGVYVENQHGIQGFILGTPVKDDTIGIHFLYGWPGMDGVYQVLIREAAGGVFSRFRYMNLEQDLGIPGLRKSKASYQPEFLEKKYEIRSLRPFGEAEVATADDEDCF